jgi:hypothetical protein
MVAMSQRLGASDLQYNAIIYFDLKNGTQENSASAHLTLYSACMESTEGMCRHSIRYLLPLVLGGGGFGLISCVECVSLFWESDICLSVGW